MPTNNQEPIKCEPTKPTEEIVADILNTIINNVVLNSELKSRGETSKKSVVEL
jgi:hypothetical protein